MRKAGVTTGRGFYQLSGVTPGRYGMAISFVGYGTYRDTLDLSSGDRRTVSVSLSVVPRELEAVTVSGQAEVGEREAGAREIRAADLETIPTPGPGGDLASYLRSLPSVTALGDRGGRISSVLDVQLRAGNTKSFEGSVGGGPFMATGHLEGPLQEGGKSFLVHARHSTLEPIGPIAFR